MERLLSNTLSQSAFWMVNKALARELESTMAAILLADLVSKRDYFANRGELDEYGGFFNIAKKIENDLCITKEERQKLTNKLIDKGFIRCVKRGIPAKNYYYIQDEAIVTFLNSYVAPDPSSTGLKKQPTREVEKQPTRGLKKQPVIRSKNKNKEQEQTNLASLDGFSAKAEKVLVGVDSSSFQDGDIFSPPLPLLRAGRSVPTYPHPENHSSNPDDVSMTADDIKI